MNATCSSAHAPTRVQLDRWWAHNVFIGCESGRLQLGWHRQRCPQVPTKTLTVSARNARLPTHGRADSYNPPEKPASLRLLRENKIYDLRITGTARTAHQWGCIGRRVYHRRDWRERVVGENCASLAPPVSSQEAYNVMRG